MRLFWGSHIFNFPLLENQSHVIITNWLTR